MYRKRKSVLNKFVGLIVALIIMSILLSFKTSLDKGTAKDHVLLRWSPEQAEVIEVFYDSLDEENSSDFERELNKAFE